MSAYSRILKVLKPLGYPVVPELYTGTEKIWITYNYADERGTDFSDNKPQANEASVQVHFFCPMEENFLKMKNKICELLFQAGFTYPSIFITTEPENKIRHITYECKIDESMEE